ncbi:TolC family protein [Clostridium sp. JNZ X4-2]
MNKKLILIIALVMSVGMSSSVLADSPSISVGTAVNSKEVSATSDIDTGNLTLNDALNSLEKRNVSIQLMDQKVILLNKQYDDDHQNSIDVSEMIYSVNKNSNEYISLKEQELIKPQQSAQDVENAKHDREDALKNLKSNMERQYMSVVNNRAQITNINASIANVDKQIDVMKIKISQGVATSDALQQLNVQKSQLMASLNTPKSNIEQSILNIKQMLNLDLNSDLVLVPAKKDYVKFDDSNIEDRIDNSVKNDYDLVKINKNIEFAKMDVELNTKYGTNNTSGQVTSQLNLQNLTNSLNDTTLNLKINLWTSYYNMKNKEDSVTAEKINLDNAQQNYDNALSKFKFGQVTQLEVDSSQLALEKEQLIVQNLINDYMVTVEEFQDQLK